MKRSILGRLMTILMAVNFTACATPFILKDGYTAKFEDGDCARIGKHSKFAARSDGTILELIYVDRKYVGYITYMDHRLFPGPTVSGHDIKFFDKHYVKVSCPK